MVQELPDRHALGDRGGVAVEVERAFVDELEDDRRHEDLRHAGDAEAVLRRQALARLDVGEPGGSFLVEAGPGGDGDGSGEAGADDRLEPVVERSHGRPQGKAFQRSR